jgi:hypothetical protein
MVSGPARIKFIVLADRLLGQLKDAKRRTLIEIVEDWTERRATLVPGQVPVTSWP